MLIVQNILEVLLLKSILNILLTSCVPAVISGFITYLVATKKAKSEIEALKESNRHEISKLMKQHEIDIESLNEKHKLELEKSELEQRHKIEIMELEHKNALESKEKEQSNHIVFGVLGDMLKDPNKLKSLMNLANDPFFSKNKCGK